MLLSPNLSQRQRSRILILIEERGTPPASRYVWTILEADTRQVIERGECPDVSEAFVWLMRSTATYLTGPTAP